MRYHTPTPIARWALLVAALVALAGHLCAGPAFGHAHPEPGAAAGQASAGEVLHAGSCAEGIRADRALPGFAALPASVSLPASPEPGVGVPAGLRPVAVPPAGPPRFPLHAALLI